MKRISITAVLVIGLLCGSSTFAQFDQNVRQALQAAVEDVQASLATAGIPAERTISVLPIDSDNGRYVEGLLKTAVTNANLSYVEGREDPFFDEVLKEVEWDERKEDMLDASTLDTFGRLKSTQLLLYGVVREADATAREAYVELELHLSSIETKEHLWGGIFAKRFYLAENVRGLLNLDPGIREMLKAAIDAETSGLADSPKLTGVERVALAPIAGDIDGYVTSLAENMLSDTRLIPVRTQAATLAEVRQILRDTPGMADAVLFGAVRDLSREVVSIEPLKTISEVTAEVQLRIESATDGGVLWSESVIASTTIVDKESVLGWATANWVIVAIGAIAIVVGVFFLIFLKSMRRSR